MSTSSVLFYNNIVPLNRDQHRGFRVDAGVNRFGYARNSHVIPALVDEFVAAGINLPILFTVGAPDLVPVFLVGLRTNVNALVDETGSWNGDYIPAFVRRYPFIIGEVPGSEPLACIDETATIQSDTSAPMFEEDGKETPALIERIQFANEYFRAADRNTGFVKMLTELGLFRTVSIDVKLASGEALSIQGFMTVDAEKLQNLSDEDFGKLRAAGYLAPIYAHLASLGCVERIRRVS